MNRIFAAVMVALTLNVATQARAAGAPATPAGDTWTDETTGLTWTVCPVTKNLYQKGVTELNCRYNPHYANSTMTYQWYEVVPMALQARFGGYADWRMPTVDELRTVYKCVDHKAYRAAIAAGDPSMISYKDIIGTGSDMQCPPDATDNVSVSPLNVLGSWTATTYKPPGATNQDGSPSKPSRFFMPTNREFYDFTALTVLVRGGTPGPEWQRTVAEANEINGVVDAKLAAEQQASDAAAAPFKAAAARQEAADRATMQAFQQRSATVRAHVRPGDRVAQGLVVQVRGELVQVQSVPHQNCHYYTGTGQVCENVPSQLVWIQRSTLLAPR